MKKDVEAIKNVELIKELLLSNENPEAPPRMVTLPYPEGKTDRSYLKLLFRSENMALLFIFLFFPADKASACFEDIIFNSWVYLV